MYEMRTLLMRVERKLRMCMHVEIPKLNYLKYE